MVFLYYSFERFCIFFTCLYEHKINAIFLFFFKECSAALFEKEEENGINFMLVQTSEEDTESLKGIIQENPSQIILMINPGLATEKAKQALFNDELPQKYKDAEKDARGVFGEGSITGLGILEFSSWNVQTTNYKIQELYNFAEEKKYLLFLEINAGEAQRDEFEETLIQYPNTTFLIHIEAKEFQSNEQKIRELMQKYENIYLIIDANDILYDIQHSLKHFPTKYYGVLKWGQNIIMIQKYMIEL